MGRAPERWPAEEGAPAAGGEARDGGGGGSKGGELEQEIGVWEECEKTLTPHSLMSGARNPQTGYSRGARLKPDTGYFR
jgi:hypothetical protein